MPELPEVEVVRRGLAGVLPGRRVSGVEVLHPRPVRRHPGGAEGFAAALTGAKFAEPRRRGKYLWLPLVGGDAVLAHLGMSGQFLVQDRDAERVRNTRVVFAFDDGGPQVHFVDQRMFGGLSVSPGGAQLPAEIAHIAPDVFEAAFDADGVVSRIRRSQSGIKRLLLAQTVLSGVGNIYADEALWRARVHGERPGARLSRAKVLELLGAVRDVMAEALAQGGTSFDELYVNVNGQSGYFDRSLSAYGQEGRPCPRCATPIRRVHFMNRSSFFCPRCQRRPTWAVGGA